MKFQKWLFRHFSPLLTVNDNFQMEFYSYINRSCRFCTHKVQYLGVIVCASYMKNDKY